MADGTTPNQGFTLPEVGASRDTWGTKLNTNWTDLDTLLGASSGPYLPLAGGTMTGALNVSVGSVARPIVVSATFGDASAAPNILLDKVKSPLVNGDGLGGIEFGTNGITGAVLVRGFVTDAAVGNEYIDLQFAAVENGILTVSGYIEGPNTPPSRGATLMTKTKSDNRYLLHTPLAAQTIDGGSALSPITLKTVNNATAQGPNIVLQRDRTSHLVSDLTGSIVLNLDGGTKSISARGLIRDVTSGSEDIDWDFTTLVNGTQTVAARITGPGAASPEAFTIITRQKGDTRYQAISSKRYKTSVLKKQPETAGTRKPAVTPEEDRLAKAFDALDPAGWIWGNELPASDERVGKPGYGFIVEDVEVLFPEAVIYQSQVDEITGIETERPHAIDPVAIAALAVGKIKLLEAQLNKLQAIVEHTVKIK